MKIYRGTDGDVKPIECECDKFGWPEVCITPDYKEETQYENTHFKTKKEAWKSITESVKAGKSINKRIEENKKIEWEHWQKIFKEDEKRYKTVMNDKNNPYKENK